jgi:hypothetical protein
MNNSPQCALCIGYKETLVEEMVNMKFLVFQSDDHHTQKNHFDHDFEVKWSWLCFYVSVPLQQHEHSKNYFAYCYSVMKYGIFSGGHSSNSGKTFALYKKIFRITIEVHVKVCLKISEVLLIPFQYTVCFH